MAKDKSERNWFGRHKIITGLLILIVIGAVAGASGGNTTKTTDSNTTSGANNQPAAKTEAKVAKIGEAANDGKFEFTVSGIKCGTPSVSDSSGYVTRTAQGQYCLLSISIKNIGDKQQLFSESDQKLLNAGNQEYSPDTTATLYNSNNSDVFLSQINPGNTVTGTLVYDLPKDQTPVKAELHDSAFSGGVNVTLQ